MEWITWRKAKCRTRGDWRDNEGLFIHALQSLDRKDYRGSAHVLVNDVRSCDAFDTVPSLAKIVERMDRLEIGPSSVIAEYKELISPMMTRIGWQTLSSPTTSRKKAQIRNDEVDWEALRACLPERLIRPEWAEQRRPSPPPPKRGKIPQEPVSEPVGAPVQDENEPVSLELTDEERERIRAEARKTVAAELAKAGEQKRQELIRDERAAELQRRKTKGRSRSRGPIPGTLRRFDNEDRALFPEIDRLVNEEKLSSTAASKQLAYAGKVAGTGTPDSCATRLAKFYRRSRAGK